MTGQQERQSFLSIAFRILLQIFDHACKALNGLAPPGMSCAMLPLLIKFQPYMPSFRSLQIPTCVSPPHWFPLPKKTLELS